jgi:hypothetical protein
MNVPVSTEDVDGDGTLELVAKFFNPRTTVRFRVATGNMAMLDMSGHATAFDETQVIAGADSDASTPLPAGGTGIDRAHAEEATGGIVGPMTHTTDIKTAPANITVQTETVANFSSVAVCGRRWRRHRRSGSGRTGGEQHELERGGRGVRVARQERLQ